MLDYSLNDYEWTDNRLKTPRRGGVDLGRCGFNVVNGEYTFVFNREASRSLGMDGVTQQTLGVIYRKLKELNSDKV